MIKLIQQLHRYKPAIIIALCLPILALFFRGRFQFSVLPENPNPRFKVEFHVPNRTATEIAARITEPSEKVFNGLPGLLSMESKTSDHVATIAMIFKENIPANTAYLFLQEKLDRIRLILPRDVESINVDRARPSIPADLAVEFDKTVPLSQLQKALKPVLSSLQSTTPNLNQEISIKVHLDPLKLARENIALTQVTEAMKLSGISADLGKRGGVLFSIGRAFDSIEELKATVISARAGRPIILSDVARLELSHPDSAKELLIWFDRSRTSQTEILSLIEKSFPEHSVRRPRLRELLRYSVHPLLGLILIIGLQIFFLKRIFGKRMALSSLATFDGLILIHYVFWRGLWSGGLTLLDLHAMLLTLVLGTTLWFMLFARVRTYFLPQYKLKKIPRSVEQASLFALGELLPAFVVLAVVLWLFNLPVLMTSTNWPSRYLLESLFSTGLPVVLSILVLMPILTHASWVRDSQPGAELVLSWKTNLNVSKWIVRSLTSLVILAVGFVFWFPIGVSRNIHTALEELRGYGTRLVYLSAQRLSKTELNEQGLVPYRLNESKLYSVWHFTPSGLRFLPELQLASLAPSVRQLESESTFGFLAEGTRSIPLKFGGIDFEPADFGSLLIASKKTGTHLPRQIRSLATPELKTQASVILRNRLLVADQLVGKKSNLRRTLAGKTLPTQWTLYLQDQFRRFTRFHFIAIIFFYLLLALYLNSFIRAAITALFMVAVTSAAMLFYLIIPGAFHADSLWLFYLVPWLVLLAYLVLCRVIDVERSRGHDRDICFEEARVQFAPTILSIVQFVAAALIGIGVLDWLPWISFGLWHEAFLITLLAGLGLMALFRFLFPLLYLESEELLDQAAYRIIRQPLVRQIIRRAGLGV